MREMTRGQEPAALAGGVLEPEPESEPVVEAGTIQNSKVCMSSDVAAEGSMH